MSVSQFDDFVDEFGDSTSTSTKTGSIGAFNEDFDPFGPPPGAADTTDLLNISADVPIKNGDTSNGLDLDFETSTTAEPVDQHHDMSTKTRSSDPLFDLDSGLTNQQSNPVYDFDNDGPAEEPVDEAGLLSEFSHHQKEDAEYSQISHPQYDDNDLLGDFEVVQKEDAVYQKYEPENFNGEPDTFTIETEVLEDYTAHDKDVEEAKDGEQTSAEVDEAAEELDPVEVPAEEEEEDAAVVETSAKEVAAAEEETAPEDKVPEEECAAEEDSVPEEEHAADIAESEEEIPHATSIPNVEITESPEQDYSQEDDTVVENQTVADVEVTDEVEEDESVAAVVGDATEELESESIPTADIEHDNLVADNFGHDRREKDLEHYCMDREESDLMEDPETVHEPQMDNLKLREERSRSPSRSIGPEIPEDRERHQQSETPDTDTTEEVDALRPRDDRSQAPSRSLEPEDTLKDNNAAEDVQLLSSPIHDGNRYSESLHSPDGVKQTWKPETTYHNEPAQAVLSHSDVHQPHTTQHQQDEEDEEEGVYENKPTKRDDVVREADTDRTADLPTTGTAHSLREKFLLAQQEAAAPTRSKREITPPVHGTGGEYVSEPRGYIERYEGKAESGVFESQPVVKTDVITSNTQVEEAKIESGFAKNTAAKFKELQNKSNTPSGKRELSPDRSGRVEFVSEPRGHLEQYEGKSESGVFESEPIVNPDVVKSGEEIEENLPERGTARNLADKFRQISSDTSTTSSARGKREITPDRTGRVEYVSEPRGQHTEDYDGKVDSGVFENQPQRNTDVITSDSVPDDIVPERGYARNVAAKFKELETTVKSPPLSPGRRKEFTPPREDERFHQAGVLESTPDFKSDVVHADDQIEEALPERGTAKNMAQRFRQLETDSKTPGSFKTKKEFTPPPGDSGVFENQPKQFHADYNKPAESGIIENQPLKRDDVVRGDEPPKYEVELPERGAAKNLVSKWKQLESEGSKVKSPGSSGRPKEFTPPREEPRIAEQRNGNDQLDNGSVHPSDLPGQYQPQNEPAVFESNPQQRTDVLKEADTDWTEGMPKKDTAKKMLAKFQNIQAEANKQSPGPVSRKAKDVCNK